MDPNQYQNQPSNEANLTQPASASGYRQPDVEPTVLGSAAPVGTQQPVVYQPKKVSVWKVMFWVFGVATVLPLVAALLMWLMLIGMAEGGASGTEFMFLILVLPLMLFQFIALPALLVTLFLYLTRVKPQGKRRIVTMVALGAVLVYFVWNIAKVAIPFWSL